MTIAAGKTQHIAQVANLATVRHLVDQMEIEFFMRADKLDKSKVNEERIIKLFADALQLENYLNVLKSFLALLEYDRLTKSWDWNFKNDFERRGDQLNARFQNGVVKTLQTIKKYNPLWYVYLVWLNKNSDLIKNQFLPN